MIVPILEQVVTYCCFRVQAYVVSCSFSECGLTVEVTLKLYKQIFSMVYIFCNVCVHDR